MAEATWGEVPENVQALIDTFRASIATHQQNLSDIQWPDGTGDISHALLATVAENEAIHQTTKDLRSLLTAYAHQFHQPRPKMAAVARAQRATPQAVTSRYTAKTAEALVALLNADAELSELLRSDALVQAFPSLARPIADYSRREDVVIDASGSAEL